MPMSQRWRNFCWKLAHNILPTKDNLLKRKIVQNSSCVLCGENESASHLLLHCEVSRRIWSCSSLGIVVSDTPSAGWIIEMANAELNRWYEDFGCRKRNDITHETGKKKRTYADMVAYGWVLNQGHNVKRTGTSKISALSPLQAEAHGLLAGIKTAKAEVDVVQI
ncbi:Zinc finger protein DPF3 [Bienertia sinuspersici]